MEAGEAPPVDEAWSALPGEESRAAAAAAAAAAAEEEEAPVAESPAGNGEECTPVTPLGEEAPAHEPKDGALRNERRMSTVEDQLGHLGVSLARDVGGGEGNDEAGTSTGEGEWEPEARRRLRNVADAKVQEVRDHQYGTTIELPEELQSSGRNATTKIRLSDQALNSIEPETAVELAHALGEDAGAHAFKGPEVGGSLPRALTRPKDVINEAVRRLQVPLTRLGFQTKVAIEVAKDDARKARGAGKLRPRESSAKGTTRRDELRTSATRLGINLTAAGVLPFGILDPKSRFVRRWDVLVMALLVYTAVMTPYDVGFMFEDNSRDVGFWLSQAVDILFFLDIIVNFCLGYYDQETKRWVYSRDAIVKRYLSSWFIVDFVSILPFDAIAATSSDDNNSNVGGLQTLRLTRLLRLGKLLRVLRAARIFRRLESSFAVDYTALELTKFALVTVAIAHWMACGWGLVAELERTHGRDFTWIENVVSNSNEQTWTSLELYMAALYWSVMTITTIGYGDIFPVTSAERSYVVAAMLFGGILWGYMIGAVSGVIGARDEKLNRFRRDIKDLNSFMDEASFPSSLRMKLREYFRYQTQTYSVDRYRHLLNRLSPALRREVANQRDNSWIERVRLFQKCPEDFRIAIAMIITQTTFPPAEVVVREGELNEHMHIIRRGVVASGRRILMTGEVFGEEMLYHRSLPADCSSWTVTYCDLYTLSREQLADLLHDFPRVREAFRRLANRFVFRTEVLAYCAAVRALVAWVRKNSGKTKEELERLEEAESLNERAARDLGVGAATLSTQKGMAQSERARHYYQKLRSLVRLDPDEYDHFVKNITFVQAHVRKWLVFRKYQMQLRIKQVDMSIASHEELTSGAPEAEGAMARVHTRRPSLASPLATMPPTDASGDGGEAQHHGDYNSSMLAAQLHQTTRMVAQLHKDLFAVQDALTTNRARLERRMDRIEKMLSSNNAAGAMDERSRFASDPIGGGAGKSYGRSKTLGSERPMKRVHTFGGRSTVGESDADEDDSADAY